LVLFLDLLRSETAAEPARMVRALEGLRAYQEAERDVPRAPMPVVVKRFGVAVRDYGGSGRPVLFVPSLINPPNILDLDEQRSLLRWLATRGHHVLLLDWGQDIGARQHLSVGEHVTELLVPLMREVDPEPALVGYCLGGTMAIAAAALAPVRQLATIAAPWHFSGFPEESRQRLAALWAGAQPAVAALGLLPMEVLQSAFWSLDPRRTVTKFEAFAAMTPGSTKAQSFVALEDWANDGPPVGTAAAREMFEDFFDRDLPGTGGWRAGERVIDPAGLPCPTYHIVSTTDRIVPAASAPPGGERLDLALGHVGMVVGSRAREGLWEPLDRWLSERTAG
jgi:polyhydroxyalkanoate synthase